MANHEIWLGNFSEDMITVVECYNIITFHPAKDSLLLLTVYYYYFMLQEVEISGLSVSRLKIARIL